MGFMNWPIYRLRLKWHDLQVYGADRIQLARHSKFAIARETAGGLDTGNLGKKVAIVAVYPTKDIVFSIRNICSALSRNGYSILMVSSSKVSPELRDVLLGSCNQLLERYGFGRDFGSYAAAIHWLDRNGVLGGLESLCLVNDSVFWPSDFGEEIRSLDTVQADWKCLFEHQKVGYITPHAQSFFLVFGRKIINHPEFLRYWDEYIPLSSREHAIKKGEIGLSKCLLEAGFRPYTAYTFPRLWSALRARIDTQKVDLPLKMALFSLIDADFKQLNTATVSLAEKGNTDEIGIGDQLMFNAVQHISYRLFEQSPSHATGLLCNVLLGAPIKRDYCNKYGKPIGLVLASAQGYTGEDLEHLHAALLARGTRRQYDDFEQFLLGRGRI
ncbi:MAG: rhamnan synthesis F family protein [Hyphomicrobiales bacterium]